MRGGFYRGITILDADISGRRTGDGSLSFSAEELKAQMVAKYGQETIDAVCADADTSGWTEQDWEYQIWLYQHREEIEEVGEVRAAEDTSGWTREQWIAKLNENREKKEEEDEAESGSDTDAWKAIDEYRSRTNGLEPLGDTIPTRGDNNGTVAFVEVNGNKVFGLNSSFVLYKCRC